VNQANATVTVNGVAVSSGTASGSINLNVGDNTITLIVTAQDGSTRAVYMVTVTRAVILSNDATLSNLTISTGTLTPAFAAGTTSYTSGVAYAVTPVTVNATVNESHAAVKVNGVSVTSGSPSGWISLDVGANTITIVVTAQDGITTDTYNIIVNMALLTTTQTTPPVITVTVTNTSSSTTTTSAITTTFPPGTTDLSRDVNSTGTFIFGASASSANGDVTVNIPAGVTGLTAGGAPITQITITPITTDLPALPADGAAVGLYFDIQPSGSTFSSPITITVSYDPSLIPAGISPYVAWYNPATGQWEQLTTVSIDTVNHTITASVNHFSTFAVLAALSKTSTTASTAVGTATSNANTTATTSNATTKPSANGVIIGVIIGAVILIVLILFFIIRGRKPRGG
jgi:tRNA threonylcarbamoyladenosine modification (KEOPS) complex  Pcc1 subunit